MLNKIITVSGTQCIGKTTLIKNVLSKDIYNVKFSTVDFSYRKLLGDTVKYNRQGNIESQKIIFDSLCDDLYNITKKQWMNFLLDRSPLDAVVYTEYLCRHMLGNVTSNDLLEMKIRCKRIMKLVDLILYIPLCPENNISISKVYEEENKFRDLNIEYRKEIDEIFNSLLSKDFSFVEQAKIIGKDEQEKLECFERIMKTLS